MMGRNKPNNKSNSLLNEIFNTAADGMCLIDKEFNIFAINATLAMMLGLDKEKIIGKKCHEVLAGSACQTERCCLINILNGEKQIEFETEKLHSDGVNIPCLVAAKPFFGANGELAGIVEDIKDISC